MTVRHNEGAVTQRAVPGPALYFTSAMPEGVPKALIGIVPGYADHAGRYAHVMDFWASHGIGSVAIDLRGHGRATGPRGHISRFDEYLDDAAELARLLADRARGQSNGAGNESAKEAPLFLFGHSMGGLVAALSAIESPRAWRGLILSAPYMGLAMDVPAAKKVAGRIASRVAPRFSLPTGLVGADLTHDPARAKEHDQDPLVFPNATARWFRESSKAHLRVIARAPALKMPLFEVFGTADRIAKLQAGRAFFDAAGSADKTFDERVGLFHEVLNEIEWKDVAGAIEKWVLAHISRSVGKVIRGSSSMKHLMKVSASLLAASVLASGTSLAGCSEVLGLDTLKDGPGPDAGLPPADGGSPSDGTLAEAGAAPDGTLVDDDSGSSVFDAADDDAGDSSANQIESGVPADASGNGDAAVGVEDAAADAAICVGSASNGTPCGANEVCNGEACVACTANTPCTPTNACDRGVTSCGTGSATCSDVGGNACTDADAGLVCERYSTPTCATPAWAEWPMPNAPVDSPPAPNLQSYTNNGDGTISDNVTGLMWQQTPTEDGGTFPMVTPVAAANYCAALSIASHQDWRLPTVIELVSIVDWSVSSPSINTAYFPGTPAVSFWSSTPWPNGSVSYINFGTGMLFGSAPTNLFGVRCVR